MMFEVPLTYSHLAGFRGMGDMCYDPDAGEVECGSSTPSTTTTSGDDYSNLQIPVTQSLPPVNLNTSTPAAGSTMTPAQLAALISGSGQAASSLIRSTSSPYVIPGTNVIYNPATGQIAGSSTAVTASVLGSNLMPFLIVGTAAVMLIILAKK